MNLNDQNFKEEIKKANQPILVDFFANWCFPCRILSPVLDKIAKDYQGKIILAKINIDESPRASIEYGIEAVPTILLFKQNQLISSFTGTAGEAEIKNWLDKNLEKIK